MSSRSALIVADFQIGVVARHAAEAALGRAVVAIGAARQHGLPVLFVRVAFRPGHPEVNPRNAAFGALKAAGRLVEGDHSTELHPDLGVRPGEPVVVKRRVSAFAGSDLDVLLRGLGVQTLVLAGVSTSGVVLSTVRQAADLDYGLVVLSDACTDLDAVAHDVLVERIFPRQTEVMTVDAWSASVSSGS